MHRRVNYFHTHFHRSFALIAIVAAASAFLLASCTGGDDTPVSVHTATSVPSTQPTIRAVGGEPGGSASPERQPWPDGQPVEQSKWVKDRLAAVKQIYRFTPEGEAWIDGYDFRQMVEQPAWFGSHGFGSWAGAGEAVPRSVLHELGHSYWGAFSVEGRPELSWQGSGGLAPALTSYRDDFDAFLKQPPDRFEPLRDRFRNLPRLNVGEYSDLFHFGEADLLFMTGGNLQLVPPILRKYVTGYLLPGGAGPEGGGELLDSWDIALGWFAALSSDDKRIASEIFGLQHFPYEPYANLPKVELSDGSQELDAGIRAVYEGEERQRLIDFAGQLDGVIEREFSLVDAAGADRGFDFWRSYLSDKMSLNDRYPEVLSSIGTARATDLAAALDLYGEMQALSAGEQAQRYRESQDRSLVPELAVLMKPRAIVELFAESGDAGGIAAVLGSRAERLTALVEVVGNVEAAGDTASGSAELERFIGSLPEDQLRSDMFLLLDLLRSADQGLASRVLPALSNDTLLLLLRVQPAAARAFEIGPDRLLEALGIGQDSALSSISIGAQRLAENSSGNFQIDAAYDEAVFSHLDRFVQTAPAGVLGAVASAGMRFVPWISRDSDGALRAMRMEPEVAAGLLLGLAGSRETPERIIHLIARKDADLAADLTVSAANTHGQGAEFVASVLSEFAYDAYWSVRRSGPNVNPERLAEYLVALSGRLGEPAAATAIANAIQILVSGGENGDLEPGGDAEFGRTVEVALEAVSGETASTFSRIVERSFPGGQGQ